MHVIYVRGLGDNRASGQRLAVALWRVYGVRPHFFEHKWSDSETFAEKLDRLSVLIDELHKKSGQAVGLVGTSAGASLALNAYAVRTSKVLGVVCISGKILHPERMHGRVMKHNPAFRESMQQLAVSLPKLAKANRAKILSVYSDGDKTVPMEDSIIEGVKTRLAGHGSHGLTIAQQITIGARRNLRFLKKLSYHE